MFQKYSFGVAPSVYVEIAGIDPMRLHHDADAILQATAAGAALHQELGLPPPVPALAGLGYVHISTLGAKILFEPGTMEPGHVPCIRTPADIDHLREPEDYLQAGVVPERLALAEELKRRRPDASTRIGHDYEGPVTTAVLLMGPDFFMLPYDDSTRAHKLLDFCTTSCINYAKTIRARQGSTTGGRIGNPDDFAGMFPPELFKEFVMPYWERLYAGQQAQFRSLHSELLREEHLPFLEQLRIDTYDPSVNPHLPPEVLARSCKVPYGLRIWPSQVQEHSADKLVKMYREYAQYHTQYIMFHLQMLADLPKIKALLAVARELEKKP